jgi:hypothetical protein
MALSAADQAGKGPKHLMHCGELGRQEAYCLRFVVCLRLVCFLSPSPRLAGKAVALIAAGAEEWFRLCRVEWARWLPGRQVLLSASCLAFVGDRSLWRTRTRLRKKIGASRWRSIVQGDVPGSSSFLRNHWRHGSPWHRLPPWRPSAPCPCKAGRKCSDLTIHPGGRARPSARCQGSRPTADTRLLR